jgi:iron complex outermembrane receptor protein
VLLNGQPTASGAQVFAGFRPENAGSEDRTAVGAYVDLEANVTDKFLASVAVRGEHYSDFGENLSGKLAARYDFTQTFALRASVSERLPCTLAAAAVLRDDLDELHRRFAVRRNDVPGDRPDRGGLGAKKLDAEESLNYSIGAVLRFDRVDITIDAYRIDIDRPDRALGEPDLGGGAHVSRHQGFIGAGGGRFFINGVDTRDPGRRRGVELAVRDGRGRFDFTFTATGTRPDVTSVPSTPQLAALSPPPVLVRPLQTS